MRNEGYPVLKLLAQFYLDFLKEEPDGKFHAFPSNQGEDGFTGNLEAYRDLPQILLHIRFALAAAEYAAKELDADPEFRALCRDRIDRLADMKRCASVPRRAVDNWEEVTDSIDEQSRETVRGGRFSRSGENFFRRSFSGSTATSANTPTRNRRPTPIRISTPAAGMPGNCRRSG